MPSEEDYKAAMSAYQDGMSLQDIKKAYGIHGPMLYKRMRKSGISQRNRKNVGAKGRFEGFRGGRTPREKAKKKVKRVRIPRLEGGSCDMKWLKRQMERNWNYLKLGPLEGGESIGCSIEICNFSQEVLGGGKRASLEDDIRGGADVQPGSGKVGNIPSTNNSQMGEERGFAQEGEEGSSRRDFRSGITLLSKEQLKERR